VDNEASRQKEKKILIFIIGSGFTVEGTADHFEAMDSRKRSMNW